MEKDVEKKDDEELVGSIEDEDYKANDTNFHKLAQEIDSMVAKLKNPSKKSTSCFGSDTGEIILEEDFQIIRNDKIIILVSRSSD